MSQNAEIYDLQAYREQLNISLFNDIIEFIVATTSADTAPVFRTLTGNHLWYTRTENDNIQEQYGFRYFGELLERYEDKAGSDIKDIRAIALAMAYTKGLLTDDMFVGSQRSSFLRRITRLSAGDTYIKGALYLLSKGEPVSDKLLELLTQAAYKHTEELIFVLSLHDDFEQAFHIFRPQLVGLLGTERTMPVFGNVGVYSWLIRKLLLSGVIKHMRAKDISLLRALTELPTSFVRQGKRPHDVLLDNGYTTEEILYLNSSMVYYKPIRDALDPQSITAEKIAVDMCRTFINSDGTHSQDVYGHMEYLLKRYESFAIKISGFNGIFEAIKNEIMIINPQTFVWLFRLIAKKDIFRFDIMEDKWNILPNELSSDDYRDLFNKQLLENTELAKAQIIERIQKYDTLTGMSYLAHFERRHEWSMDSIFAILVNNGLIDLVSAFNTIHGVAEIKGKAADEDKYPLLLYIGTYIRGIRTREAFDFFRYFFSEHNFEEMHRLFIEVPKTHGYRDLSHFFQEPLFRGYQQSYSDRKNRFDIERTFLTDDEHRELFGWLDDYMLQYDAGKYAEFAALMLLDPFVRSLFPANELRRIYDMIRGIDIKAVTQNCSELRRLFLSEAELQAERDAEESRKAFLKKQERENQLHSMRDDLVSAFDGTFKALIKYLDAHKYSWQHSDDALVITAEYLVPTLEANKYVLDKAELGRFLQFSGSLVKGGIVGFDTIRELISVITEETVYVEDSGTPEFDNEAQ